jgi:hypothetical protein
MRGSPWPYPKEVDDIGLGRPLFTCSDRVYRGGVTLAVVSVGVRLDGLCLTSKVWGGDVADLGSTSRS